MKSALKPTMTMTMTMVATNTEFIGICEAPIVATDISEPMRLTLEYYYRLGLQLIECKRLHSEADYLHSLRLAEITPAYANACMAVARKYTSHEIRELEHYEIEAFIVMITDSECLNEIEA